MQTQLEDYEQLVAFDAFVPVEKNTRLTEYVSELRGGLGKSGDPASSSVA
jgi:hypothetical protein